VDEQWQELLRTIYDARPPQNLPLEIRRRELLMDAESRSARPRRYLVWAGATVGCVLLLIALALAAHSRRVRDGELGSTPPPASRRIIDNGVTVRLPTGWTGRSLHGRLEVRNYAGTNDPSAGQVWAAIDEYGVGLAMSGGLRYPELNGSLSIRPGQFTNARLAGGDFDASRLFSSHGRFFQLKVVYGDATPSAATIRSLNGVLATLKIEPTTAPPVRLEPALFRSAGGWHTGGDSATIEQPEGTQLCAWASTIRYRDQGACPIPSNTISALKGDDMVISVTVARTWARPEPNQLPRHITVPAAVTTVAEGGYRSVTIEGRARTGYDVVIQVYIARTEQFTSSMRLRAQQEIDRLRLPDWSTH
jgi:hypothetical protein